MVLDLSVAAAELGIKYFPTSFTDVFGVVHSKLIPAHAIASILVVIGLSEIWFGKVPKWLMSLQRCFEMFSRIKI